jgi:hypothetical protein
MPNIVKEQQINAFVKGLITEASPLTFPENASLDEENFVLNLDGSRSRRLGLQITDPYSFTNTAYTDATIRASKVQVFYWPNPGGSTTVSLAVIRVKEKLFFLNLLSDPVNNLYTYTFASGIGNFYVDMAVVNGILVVTSDRVFGTPVYFTWNSTTNVPTKVDLDLNIRDFYGVDDSLAVTTRPAALSALHHYNLLNQGWNNDRMRSTCGVAISPIVCTFNTVNPVTPGGVPIPAGYPSNADIMQLGKSGLAASLDWYDPLKLYANSTDNAPAPKGHFIINSTARGDGRIAATALAVPSDNELGVVSCVASYAGRAFYSGIISTVTDGDLYSPNYSGYIFFSQIVTSADKLSKCYQENDPTSPDISDILDTDGGTIHIPEASKIVKLFSYGNSLLVFAENGVWEIVGENGVFRATSYQTNKVTNIGTTCQNTIVEGGGHLFYWTISGIYEIIPEESTGRLTVQSITQNTIQTVYNKLSSTCKQNAKGFYDEQRNTIRWLYNNTSAYSSSDGLNRYNKQLNLNLALKAFTIYSPQYGTNFDNDYISDFIKQLNYVSTDSTSRIEPYYLLLFSGGYFVTSKYRDKSFLDWDPTPGVGTNYISYLVTGHEVYGDISHTKQVPYIVFYFDRTEENFILSGSDLVLDYPSSCLVQAQWDWCNSSASGKWGVQFQAYRLLRNYIPAGPEVFNYGERVITTKNKLRGSGRALSLKIQSETGKDMKLLGWSSDLTVKPKV